VDPLIAVDGEGAHVMQVCNESDKEKYPSWWYNWKALNKRTQRSW